MKKLLLSILVATAIVGLYFHKFRDLLPNGDFETCRIPEGVLISTNHVEGWSVEGGTVGLYRTHGSTFVVWDANNLGSLRTDPGITKRECVMRGTLAWFSRSENHRLFAGGFENGLAIATSEFVFQGQQATSVHRVREKIPAGVGVYLDPPKADILANDLICTLDNVSLRIE